MKTEEGKAKADVEANYGKRIIEWHGNLISTGPDTNILLDYNEIYGIEQNPRVLKTVIANP